MRTFDGWETQLYGDVLALPGQSSENELAHYRTKGSKNGVRRYQTESGEWTPLGLKERKAREGWGSKEERKAAREAKRSERRAARAERKASRVAARNEARAAFKEKRRQNDVKQLTDEELKKRLERVKMEQEYRELSKSPARKAGEKLVMDYLENRRANAERRYQEKQKATEYAREMLKLKEQTKQKQLQADADKLRYESEKARAAADEERAKTDAKDIEAGTRKMKLKNEKRSLKLQGKRFVSDNTVRGGIRKGMNAVSAARGQGRAERIKERSFVSGVLRGKKRIDKYNRKLGENEQKLEYDPNAWDREKNRDRRGNNNNDGGKKKKGNKG